MNRHKHARLTYARRHQMVRQMTAQGLSATAAACLHVVTPPTVRKWLGRYLAEGKPGLMDASSRPKRKRLLTDSRSAFRSKDFARACADLCIRHKFTCAYRPQTNGKAERFIQPALG